MGCKVLSDRVGKPVCGVKGKGQEHALAVKVVDFTEECDLDEPGAKAIISFAKNPTRHMMVKVAIESQNGEEYRCWRLDAVENAHREDPSSGKTRNYNRLKDFRNLAQKLRIKPVVLANHILSKVP